jgi:hypothetical protein
MEKMEQPVENIKGPAEIGGKKNCIAKGGKAYSRSSKTRLPRKPREKYNQATQFRLSWVRIP